MISDAVFFVTRDLQIVDANAAAIGSSGYLADELKTMSLDDLLGNDAQGQWRAGIEQLLAGETLDNTLPAWQRTKNGSSFDVQVQLRVIDGQDEPLLVAVVQSTGDDRQLDELLERRGYCDYLTALPTRLALESRLRRAERQARRRHTRFAVLFIDVDKLKSVNDECGHRTGDLLLKAFAERLRACVRPSDFVARYGGDEFVAVIEDVRADEEVEGIASRVRAALGAPVEIAGRSLQSSASVGVAIGCTFSKGCELVDAADRAMYHAKSQSRVAAGPARLC